MRSSKSGQRFQQLRVEGLDMRTGIWAAVCNVLGLVLAHPHKLPLLVAIAIVASSSKLL